MCGRRLVYPEEVVAMSGTDKKNKESTENRALWLRSQATEVPDDAAERFLELADDGEIARVIARACALVPPPARGRGRVLPFLRPAIGLGAVRGVAEWASLAAALAMVGWLGFAMGSDALLALGQAGQPSQTSFLHELIDPDNGVLHDLGVELRT